MNIANERIGGSFEPRRFVSGRRRAPVAGRLTDRPSVEARKVGCNRAVREPHSDIPDPIGGIGGSPRVIFKNGVFAASGLRGVFKDDARLVPLTRQSRGCPLHPLVSITACPALIENNPSILRGCLRAIDHGQCLIDRKRINPGGKVDVVLAMRKRLRLAHVHGHRGNTGSRLPPATEEADRPIVGTAE